MGLFSKMFSDARKAVNSYVGDDAVGYAIHNR